MAEKKGIVQVPKDIKRDGYNPKPPNAKPPKPPAKPPKGSSK